MRFKKILQRLGPGFITGAADDDPSGIATYAQTGAQFGYGHLWTALFSFPLMVVVQEMCGRIGLITGDGLASIIKKNYSKKVLLAAVMLLLLANMFNIGADLGAMAAALELVFGLPALSWLLFITFLTITLEVFVSYPRYAKILKWLTLSLFAYVVAAFAAHVDWHAVAWSTFVPTIKFDRASIINIVALLGTTISPYLFFWQTDEEVEEEITSGKMKSIGGARPVISKNDLRLVRVDTVLGMLFSNLVMFFIIVTTAATLGLHGAVSISSAAEAAEALRPFAGDFAFVLFALGIVGTGMLAVPILAGSASYAVAEALGWKEGLFKKFSQAKGFYLVIAAATFLGMLMNFFHVPAFAMLYYSAILNGFTAPVLLVLILFIANNRSIMGSYTNSVWSNVLGGGLAVIMFSALAGLFFL